MHLGSAIALGMFDTFKRRAYVRVDMCDQRWLKAGSELAQNGQNIVGNEPERHVLGTASDCTHQSACNKAPLIKDKG